MIRHSSVPDAVVRLAPLSDAEYAEFSELHVLEYAHQLVRAGELPREGSVSIARARLEALVAGRLRTLENHEFLGATSAHDGVRVGWIWFSPAPDFLGSDHSRTRWLSQLTVAEAHRGRGFGRAILVEAERRLASEGVEQIWLRVFDWNVVARRLYESLDYELANRFPTDVHLRKRLR